MVYFLFFLEFSFVLFFWGWVGGKSSKPIAYSFYSVDY